MSCSQPPRNTMPASLLYLVLAQLSARAVLGQISIPPSPTAAPDSNIGFWMSGTLAHGTECSEGYTFTTSRTFVNCCALTDTNCNFITKCRSREVIWSHGANSICQSDATCGSAVILDNYQDPQTRWSWIFCDTKGIENLTIYRNWDRQSLGPALITDSVSSKVSTSTVQLNSIPTSTAPETSTGGTSTSPKAILTANNPTPTPTSPVISSSSSPPETPPPTSSKAWIAAAITGPIVVLSALGLFAFWWKRRRRRRRAKKEPLETSSLAPADLDLAQYHELPVHSMSSKGTDEQVAELPGCSSWFMLPVPVSVPVFELESRESKRAGDPKGVEVGLPRSLVYEVE
ncbi:hypothetical protein B0T20DRAFT_395139 [Sordaria brevicollis]|uniref:Uncharacterized protein n=1 Tax=Sordaria brevicollis TaxID=83679 RepID=A0AAE0PBN6_SORBR|nr:hypothetical protein B0T20DRAFT_395139 [Sordaria brevicollis]